MELLVHLLLIGGGFGSPGHFDATFLLHAMRSAVGELRAHASLVVRHEAADVKLYSKDVTPDDVERVRILLRPLIDAEESLELRANLRDTSFGWMRLWLTVVDDARRWALDEEMQLSGFEGRHAPALSAALREMISLSGAGPVWILDRLDSV